MTLDEEIENLQYQINKIDGLDWKWNLSNRVFGLGHVALGTFFLYQMPYSAPVSIPYILDGVGDLLTGKHHFGSESAMEELLLSEGIQVIDNQVQDFNKVFWNPNIELG